MNRRSLLVSGGTAVGVSVAGCLGDPAGSGDGDGGGGDGGDNDGRTVSLADLDPDPDDHGVEFDGEVEEPGMGGDGPARLRLTATNAGDRDLRLSGGNRPVFGETNSREPEGLWLLREGRTDEAEETDDGCWMVESPVALTEELGLAELGPGDSEAVVTDVYVGSEEFDGRCPDAGTYRFVQEYRVETREEGETEETDWEESAAFEWGFSLEVA